MKQNIIFFLCILVISCQGQTLEQKLLVEGENVLKTIKQKKFKKINNSKGKKHSEGDIHYLNYLSNFLDTMKEENKLVGKVTILSKPLYEVSYSFKKNDTSSEKKLVSFTFVTDEDDEHYQIGFFVTPIPKDNWMENIKISDSTANDLLKAMQKMLKEESEKAIKEETEKNKFKTK